MDAEYAIAEIEWLERTDSRQQTVECERPRGCKSTAR
jgi:hypothetical protein